MLSRRGQSTEDVINLQAHSQMSSLLAPSNYHSRVYSALAQRAQLHKRLARTLIDASLAIPPG